MIEQEQIYELLKNYLSFVKQTLKLKDDLIVNFDTMISHNGEINAEITRKNGGLLVKFTDFFVKNIADSIDYKYFADLDEETASSCSNIFYSFLFRYFEGTTCLIEFKNLITYFVVLNVFNHEISHYLLGHLDEGNGCFSENESSSKERGIAHIVKEYAADTIGIFLTLQYIFDKNFSEITAFNICDEKTTPDCIKQLFVTFLSAIYVQYDLLSQFSNNGNGSWNIEERSHPHIFVRLINSEHLLNEFIVNKLNEANNLTDRESNSVIGFFVRDALNSMLPFFKANFKLSLSDVLLSKNAWEQRFAILDYAQENGLGSKPIIDFRGFAKFDEKEKQKILNRCK